MLTYLIFSARRCLCSPRPTTTPLESALEYPTRIRVPREASRPGISPWLTRLKSALTKMLFSNSFGICTYKKRVGGCTRPRASTHFCTLAKQHWEKDTLALCILSAPLKRQPALLSYRPRTTDRGTRGPAQTALNPLQSILTKSGRTNSFRMNTYAKHAAGVAFARSHESLFSYTIPLLQIPFWNGHSQ